MLSHTEESLRKFFLFIIYLLFLIILLSIYLLSLIMYFNNNNYIYILNYIYIYYSYVLHFLSQVDLNSPKGRRLISSQMKNAEHKSRHWNLLFKSLSGYLCVYIYINTDKITSKFYSHSFRKTETNISGLHVALIFAFLYIYQL